MTRGGSAAVKDATESMSRMFADTMASIVQTGGLGALRAAALSLVELVTEGMPDELREQFLLDLVGSFAKGANCEVVMPEAPSIKGMH